jgi:chromosome segregation ATPase
MKKYIVTVALLVGTLMFAGSCETKKENAQEELSDAQQDAKEERAEVAEDLQDAKEDASAKRADITAELKQEEREFLQTMEERRMEIENRIAKIDRDIDKANDTEKIRLRAQRDRLDARLKDVDEDITELKGGLKRDWKEFKSDFQKNIDELKRDLKD